MDDILLTGKEIKCGAMAVLGRYPNKAESDVITRCSRGNILKADAEALVNPVNCAGSMGKGLALQFKKAFPENFKAYELACKNRNMRLGKVLVFETGYTFKPKYIINFPTKRHWQDRSRLEDIEIGLQSLVDEVIARRIKTIAVPPLGCGLGGLSWETVRPMVEKAFSQFPNVKVFLFEPR